MLAQRLARKTDKPNPFVLAWKVVSQRQLWIWVESIGLAQNGEKGKREKGAPCAPRNGREGVHVAVGLGLFKWVVVRMGELANTKPIPRTSALHFAAAVISVMVN